MSFIGIGFGLINQTRMYARPASEKPFEPQTMEELIDGLRDKQLNSTRVKPHLANEASPVPKGTFKNFELFETAVPPAGKELVFIKGANTFHIDSPLSLTEPQLTIELKKFLSLLDKERNYSVHVIANYPQEKLGFRSILKSFLISPSVPAAKLRDFIMAALKAQLDRYKVDEITYLVLQYKECHLVKERGPLRDIINLSSDVLREYGYDWADRLKDKHLYPFTTMYHIETLLKDAQTARSTSRLFEIKEALEKYASILNDIFAGSPTATDKVLKDIDAMASKSSDTNLVSQIVDAVKKAFIEKDKERQLSTQLFVTKMKAQYEKSNKKLERILQENKIFKEELKQTKVAFCVKFYILYKNSI